MNPDTVFFCKLKIAIFEPISGAPGILRRPGRDPASWRSFSSFPEIVSALGDFFELSETPGRAAIHGFAFKFLRKSPAPPKSFENLLIFLISHGFAPAG